MRDGGTAASHGSGGRSSRDGGDAIPTSDAIRAPHSTGGAVNADTSASLVFDAFAAVPTPTGPVRGADVSVTIQQRHRERDPSLEPIRHSTRCCSNPASHPDGSLHAGINSSTKINSEPALEPEPNSGANANADANS